MSDKKPQSGEFCWNELMTPDVKKAKEFYSALFGWKTQDHEMGDMTYTMVENGDKGIGGMMQTPKDKQIPPILVMKSLCERGKFRGISKKSTKVLAQKLLCP